MQNLPKTLHQWMEAMEEYIDGSHHHVDPATLNGPCTFEQFVEDFRLFIEHGGADYIEFTNAPE
jgi:hypothetical protein